MRGEKTMPETLQTLAERITVLSESIGARFDAVDRRFDAVDARFDAVDARFKSADDEFKSVSAAIAEQRGYTEHAYNALNAEMNAGFGQVAGRFDQLDRTFDSVVTLLTARPRRRSRP